MGGSQGGVWLEGPLGEEEKIICIYNEAGFLQAAEETEKYWKMDLFIYGSVRDFPQQLKSIRRANYTLDRKCEGEISFNFIVSFQLAVPPQKGKKTSA